MLSNKEPYDQLHRQIVLDKQGYLHKPALPWEILDYLEREIPLGSKILELGSGGGYLAHWLQAKGYDVLATDISQVALDVAKSNYPELRVHMVDASDISLEDNSFDVVLSVELIEHLSLPTEHVKQVHRILKSEGIYIVKTPNRLWNRLFDRIQPRRYVTRHHVSLFSATDLQHLLSRNGFPATS